MRWFKQNIFSFCFFGYLFAGTLSYGHSYWKFKPCESNPAMTGLAASLSAAAWPMYVSYVIFQPTNYDCGEIKK